MTTDVQHPATDSLFRRVSSALMAICLGVMAMSVFVNVVLRYGFGSGIAASEELSRLLFVWMVFIGATAAYPVGEHMVFTSLVGLLRKKPRAMAVVTVLIRLLVVGACALVAANVPRPAGSSLIWQNPRPTLHPSPRCHQRAAVSFGAAPLWVVSAIHVNMNPIIDSVLPLIYKGYRRFLI